MKKLLVLFILCLPFLANAQCKETSLRAWPYGDAIQINPVIVLMGYSDAEHLIFELNKKHQAFLENRETNELIPLIVKEFFYGQFNISQALLKPESALTPGQTYDLVIQNLNDSITIPRKWHRASKRFVQASWRAVDAYDSLSPSWKKEPREKDKEVVHMGCQAQRFVIYQYETNETDEHLLRTELSSPGGKTFTCLLLPDGGEVRVGHGECVGEFFLENETKYKVNFRVMDSSGHLSGSSRERSFIMFDEGNY